MPVKQWWIVTIDDEPRGPFAGLGAVRAQLGPMKKIGAEMYQHQSDLGDRIKSYYAVTERSAKANGFALPTTTTDNTKENAMHTILTEDQFHEMYQPIESPEGTANAGSMTWDHADTLAYPREQVWTIIDDGGETNNWYASAGYHIVNVIGYCVTQKPWVTGDEEAMFFDASEFPSEDEGQEEPDLTLRIMPVTKVGKPDEEWPKFFEVRNDVEVFAKFDTLAEAEAYIAQQKGGKQ